MKALGIVLLCAAATTASATERQIGVLLRGRLTAERAVQIALLNNRSLQMTFAEVGIAKADLVEAGLLKNPSVEGSVRFPDEGSGTNNEVALSFDLLDLLQRAPRRKGAGHDLAGAELRAADAAVKLSAEVKSAFYDLQAKHQLAARMAEVTHTNAAALELYERQHAAGTISELELATQRASYSEARIEAAELDVEIRRDREKLNQLMGLWGRATGWRAAEELPPLPGRQIPIARLETLAIAQRRDLAATKAEIAAIVQNLGLTKTYRFTPEAELGVSTEAEPNGERVTGPSLRMELPVFNQGQGRIAKLQAQLLTAERRLEAEAIEIRSAVREARDRMLAKYDRARLYRAELLPERKRVLDLTLTHYNAMLKSPYDLVRARQDELAAERGYLEALRDYWIARAELERAVGGSLTSVIRTNEGGK